ncbi:unnamed protein product, partial [Allacma fusca]
CTLGLNSILALKNLTPLEFWVKSNQNKLIVVNAAVTQPIVLRTFPHMPVSGGLVLF